MSLRGCLVERMWLVVLTDLDALYGLHHSVRQHRCEWFQFFAQHIHPYTDDIQRSANLVTNVTHLMKGIEMVIEEETKRQ